MKNSANPKLACLLLAAGGSERLGGPKQLLKFRGESLVLRSARLLLTQSPKVIVVTGAFAADVGRQLDGLRVRIVRNENWQQGMGGSIASGMGAVDVSCDGVLVMLCDQWRIGQRDLGDLVCAWKEDLAVPVVARWKGSYGPPAIFPRQLFSDLRQLQGDQGAKALMTMQLPVHYSDIPNAQYDLDTKEDLRTMNAWNQHKPPAAV